MSYYLEILSETSYQKFLSQINYDSMPLPDPIVYSILSTKQNLT